MPEDVAIGIIADFRNILVDIGYDNLNYEDGLSFQWADYSMDFPAVIRLAYATLIYSGYYDLSDDELLVQLYAEYMLTNVFLIAEKDSYRISKPFDEIDEIYQTAKNRQRNKK